MDKDDGIKPKIGMQFDSEEDAYHFYKIYGSISGFSIRRQYAHKSRQDISKITSRRFSCSKSGCKEEDKCDRSTIKRPQAETRTKCKARMGIKLLENGKYECNDFVEGHNHKLHTPSTAHMMRSQQKISNVQVFGIELVSESGIKTKDMIQYMGAQDNGSQNIDYVALDHCNYLKVKRRNGQLRYGEVGSLLQYFEDQVRLNPLFTYRVQLDVDELITNLFWADAQMIMDYELFGDVVTFDTTFCKNKENRPFSIFSGFNHHAEIVIFGAALLYDETAESFKWLFNTFLETHGHKKPKTIFTDQDATILKVISEVFIGSFHGLCTWQLMQNAVQHLGNLRKDGISFLSHVQKCMCEYEEEVDFETAWTNFFNTEYVVGDDSWLDLAYKLKHKWARCYVKYTFTGGMQNKQLSENLNADMNDYTKCTMGILCFLKHFAKIVESKRRNELKTEFDAQCKNPKNKHMFAPIMCQAASMYTPKIFNLFQCEYDWVPMCYIKHRNENIERREYVVGILKSDKEYQVKINPNNFDVECSCRKFESFGILCRHVLKVFDILDIKIIPDAYILRRWTLTARSMSVEYDNSKQVEEDVNMDHTKRYNFICRTLVKIALQASRSMEGFEYVNNVASNMCKHLDTLVMHTANPLEDEPSEYADVNIDTCLKKRRLKKIQGTPDSFRSTINSSQASTTPADTLSSQPIDDGNSRDTVSPAQVESLARNGRAPGQ